MNSGYKMINDYTVAQTRHPGCFVAGTLVYTQEGLWPIEQIQIGDYVLSKPENSPGDPSYQRVIKVFKYEDWEVYFLSWEIPDSNINRADWERGYVVVTPAHPVWVRRQFDFDSDIGVDVFAWMSVGQLYQEQWNLYWKEGNQAKAIFEFEMYDGRCARSVRLQPLLVGKRPDVGIGFMDVEYWQEDPCGVEVTFTAEGPVTRRHSRGYGEAFEYLGADELLDDPEGYPEDSIAYRSGYAQMRRAVFNLEVECNHTYYVGEMGVLVHDASGI